MILALSEHPEGVTAVGGPCVVYDLARGTATFGTAAVPGAALVWTLLVDGGDARLVAQSHEVEHAADERRREGRGRPGLVAQSHELQAASLVAHVELDREREWLVRCDRVDFPPGGVAHRHVHPGPGVRRMLHGELTIDRGDGAPRTYRAGDAWFEGAGDPVVATASPTEETAFVRVLLLPAEWAGRRTIRYLDPADEERPKLQRATILLEEPLPR